MSVPKPLTTTIEEVDYDDSLSDTEEVDVVEYNPRLVDSDLLSDAESPPSDTEPLSDQSGDTTEVDSEYEDIIIDFTPRPKRKRPSRSAFLSAKKYATTFPVVKTKATSFKGREKKKNSQTVWKANPPSSSKTRKQNLLNRNEKYNQLTLPKGTTLAEPIDAFELFFDQHLLNMIVKFTNLKARSVEPEWKDCDEIEIRAFLGLIIAAGAMKQNMTSDTKLWDPIFGGLVFRATMSINRFRQLRRHLRFDDPTTRNREDKFAPIREFWEHFEPKLASFYRPGEELTIDEQMDPYLGRCPFRVYNPAKPDRYGMLIYWVVDPATNYPLHGIPYLGKGDSLSQGQGIAHNVVRELLKDYHNTQRNVTTDNFFTNKAISEELLESGLTMVGTLRSKPWIPAAFKNKKRQLGECLYGFRDYATLLSYQAKPNKNVLLYSTKHVGPTGHNESEKPPMVIDYNKFKGGVDTVDQMIHEYSCKRMTSRWPVSSFYNILNVALLAAYTLFTLHNPTWRANDSYRRVNFYLQVVNSLIHPFLKARAAIPTLQRPLKAEIKLLLARMKKGEEDENTESDIEQNLKLAIPLGKLKKVKKTRQVCAECPSAKKKQTPRFCNICEKPVCKNHSDDVIICAECKCNNLLK